MLGSIISIFVAKPTSLRKVKIQNNLTGSLPYKKTQRCLSFCRKLVNWFDIQRRTTVKEKVQPFVLIILLSQNLHLIMITYWTIRCWANNSTAVDLSINTTTLRTWLWRIIPHISWLKVTGNINSYHNRG